MPNLPVDVTNFIRNFLQYRLYLHPFRGGDVLPILANESQKTLLVNKVASEVVTGRVCDAYLELGTAPQGNRTNDSLAAGTRESDRYSKFSLKKLDSIESAFLDKLSYPRDCPVDDVFYLGFPRFESQFTHALLHGGAHD